MEDETSAWISLCICKFLAADVRCEAEVLCMQGEKHQLHFHTAQERSSLLLPLHLERGETVLGPGLGRKCEERERNLLVAGTAGDKREESQEQLSTGTSE